MVGGREVDVEPSDVVIAHRLQRPDELLAREVTPCALEAFHKMITDFVGAAQELSSTELLERIALLEEQCNAIARSVS